MLNFNTRYLNINDISALMELESSKWEPNQMADGDTLRQRIETHPELCIGAFCRESGKALASLFMRPVSPAIFTAPTRWEVTANATAEDVAFAADHRSLFGISLSSNNVHAVDEMFKFFYPRALKAGWRDVYLGSPIPGFRRARERQPGLSVWQYVHRKKHLRASQPCDPQLAYYYKKGFRQIVTVHEKYFPHIESLDYGVILRRVIPLSRPAPLWKITPLYILEPIATLMFGLAK